MGSTDVDFACFLPHFQKRYPQLPEALTAAIASGKRPRALNSVFQFLVDSEQKFRDFMAGKHPPDSAPGKLEFGPTLYLVDTYVPKLPEVGKLLEKFLAAIDFPQTKISQEEWEHDLEVLQEEGRVASDGSLVAESKYAVLDPCWLIAGIEYVFLTYADDVPDFLRLERYDFQTNPATVPIDKDVLRIALTGDWGSGVWDDQPMPACPSQMVMEQMAKRKADITIHLGDVYYAGTQSVWDGQLFAAGEESHNFVDLWQPGTLDQLTFTLNSNHEMYNGANGYFKDALNAERQSGGSTLFKCQQGTSYFAITLPDWIIFGLDSAYFDPSPLFMDGAIGNARNTQQEQFIAEVMHDQGAGKRVLVMTHHNCLTVDGADFNNPLWDQVTKAVGRPPDVWYYGHIHNGVVYSRQSAAGERTLCRCVGHGALPFGNAYELHKPKPHEDEPIDAVTYYAHTPLPHPSVLQGNRVLNGFAYLEVSKDTLSEQFYDQLGDLAWSNTTTLS